MRPGYTPGNFIVIVSPDLWEQGTSKKGEDFHEEKCRKRRGHNGDCD